MFSWVQRTHLSPWFHLQYSAFEIRINFYKFQFLGQHCTCKNYDDTKSDQAPQDKLGKCLAGSKEHICHLGFTCSIQRLKLELI